MTERPPSPPGRQPSGQHLPSAAAVVSLTLVAIGIALLGSYPHVLGDGADWPQRIALTFLLVGGAACLFHGFGWEPGNRYLQRLARPVVCWPLAAVGALGIWFLV